VIATARDRGGAIVYNFPANAPVIERHVRGRRGLTLLDAASSAAEELTVDAVA
jgi:hypothetical protein